MSITHAIAYAVLGLAVGAFGTLIGAGGGWLLAPVLVFLHPREPAANLTAISLPVGCANTTSGSLAYWRMGRVDVGSALACTAAGLPGSVLGAWATRFVERRLFDPLLGATLILGSLIILVRAPRGEAVGTGQATRVLVEKDGTVHTYAP